MISQPHTLLTQMTLTPVIPPGVQPLHPNELAQHQDSAYLSSPMRS